MSFTVTMPQLGETVTEGTILRWVKHPGDLVAEDDVLLEISTDKVDTEVPSPASGTLLEVLVPEGATVDVGTPLAVIGEAGEQRSAETVLEASPAAEPVPAEAAAAPEPVPDAGTPEPVAVAEEPEPVAAPAPSATAPAGTASAAGGVLSPVVRRLAAEHGVDVAAVVGTGRGGRITRRDIEAHIAATPAEPEVAVSVEPETRRVGLGRGIEDLMAEPVTSPVEVLTNGAFGEQAAPAAAAVTGDRVEPIGRMRGRIAANMIEAKRTAAHVWTSMEVDYEPVERVRQRHRAAFKEREGFSLTYLPFIARATMDALSAFPVVNSAFDLQDETRVFHANVNLGIGVDLNQQGLVVMTMRGADGLRMRGIAREVKRLADKARSGRLEPDDLAGSTFTITNPGPFGSYLSAPIINVPNVAILSTEGIKKRPVVITDDDGNDAIAIHHVGFLGLTWDHRAFDGSTAVLFLQRIRDNLESWDWEQELA